MADIAKKHQDMLPIIKRHVEDSRSYFQENIDRYNEFMLYTFKSSLTPAQLAALEAQGKPPLEFNIIEAYVSKFLGQFVKQQSSLSVNASESAQIEDMTEKFNETIKVVEGHIRYITSDGKTDSFGYESMKSSVGGGFSALRVGTDFLSDMSFDQGITVEKVHNPTLCGFDPMAKKSHKGDGLYCFDLNLMTKDDFALEFGQKAADEISYKKEMSGFNWSYQNNNEKVALICDFFMKKKSKDKIVKLADKKTMTQRDYDKFLERWKNDIDKRFEQPPEVVSSRMTTVTKIVRYRVCENKVLDYIETDFKFLPIVFHDGNSEFVTENGQFKQVTRPFGYNARGIQDLKNYAGQCMANELENMVQSKFIGPIEAVAEEYKDVYKNLQKADFIGYQHFLDKNSPEITIPPVREVARTPIPPQINETFRMSDEMTRVILGGNDPSSGITRADSSGIAIARNVMEGNTSSLPYIKGYTSALERVGEIILDLIPKYYVTPRSVPILKETGKRSFAFVGGEEGVEMNYDSSSLKINVDVGVNFSMQKEIAIETVIKLMKVSPKINQMMSDKGMEYLLDNVEIRGIGELKEMSVEFQKEEKEKEQQAQQQQQQEMQIKQQMLQMQMAQAQKELQSPTKQQIDLMKIQSQNQKDATNFQHQEQVDAASLSIKNQQAETGLLKVMTDINSDQANKELEYAKIDAENSRTAVEALSQQANDLNQSLRGQENDEL